MRSEAKHTLLPLLLLFSNFFQTFFKLCFLCLCGRGDGVSDGQFVKVLTRELNLLDQGFKLMEPGYSPQLVIIVGQRPAKNAANALPTHCQRTANALPTQCQRSVEF